jgi:hypothetical protein
LVSADAATYGPATSPRSSANSARPCKRRSTG